MLRGASSFLVPYHGSYARRNASRRRVHKGQGSCSDSMQTPPGVSGQADTVPPKSMSPGSEDNLSPARSRLRTHLRTFTYQSVAEMPHSMAGSSYTKPEPKSQSSRKRQLNTEIATPTVKRKRSTKNQRSASDPYSPENNLVDSLRPGLLLVIIGLNPGLTTAQTGHAYAHPSNLFWKILHWSGITPIKHQPSDTHSLPDLYQIGNTNICERATRTGAGLSKDELAAGAVTLDAKIREVKPECVCIVGKSIWETIYHYKTGKSSTKATFRYGWQDEDLQLGRTIDDDGAVEWTGAKTFVATTTSGLAAGMSTEQKLEIWKPLGEWLQRRNGTWPESPAAKEEEEEEEEEEKEGVKVEDADDRF